MRMEMGGYLGSMIFVLCAMLLLLIVSECPSQQTPSQQTPSQQTSQQTPQQTPQQPLPQQPPHYTNVPANGYFNDGTLALDHIKLDTKCWQGCENVGKHNHTIGLKCTPWLQGELNGNVWSLAALTKWDSVRVPRVVVGQGLDVDVDRMGKYTPSTVILSKCGHVAPSLPHQPYWCAFPLCVWIASCVSSTHLGLGVSPCIAMEKWVSTPSPRATLRSKGSLLARAARVFVRPTGREAA